VRLDARLERDSSRPLALALSGGGDSLALLEIAAVWARQAGRRLTAITVDHGLNPDSPDWARRCQSSARSVGADWVERRWDGVKPESGLPAAARRARHALIADAARKAGALVVLFGHTADDVAEGDWMRARGSTLGGLREWSPSPAWPEGRGLMLLRPMLEERREGLRGLLRARGRDWIEDPGNEGFGRGAARRSLNGTAAKAYRDPARAEPPVPSGKNDRVTASGRPNPLLLGEGFDGVIRLGQTVLCAAGHDRPPRPDRLTALETRLAAGLPFTATLAGARIEATPGRVVVLREAGEFRRRASVPLRLTPNQAAVWDGRYEIAASEDGWSVVPALGLLARLSDADRTLVARSPAAARGTLPILIRDGSDRPVLAWRVARVLILAPRRLMLALGETTQEKDLTTTVHGETPLSDLF
jgi:tRNA(Ile)-lysidine synthase